MENDEEKIGKRMRAGGRVREGKNDGMMRSVVVTRRHSLERR